jgi:hypothetical protein
VKTKAQIAREVQEFRKWWPSQKSIEVAKLSYKKNWWLLDLKRAVAECQRQKKPNTPENLRKRMYSDEVAVWKGRPGISRSSYFRRGYTKADHALVRRGKTWSDERRLPHRKFGAISDGLGSDDLKGVTIQTAEGWELRNPYRDKSDD